VGKSYVDAGIILWFAANRPNCLVLATAPSQTQLEEVLWKEVERAYTGARVPLSSKGRILKNPLKIDLGDDRQALAYSTTKTERLSGHHRPNLLAVLDESSGIEPPIWEAINSCNPSRWLCTGNPLRPDGEFYERVMKAERNPGVNVITIPATDSPDIHLDRSPRGLSDAGFLEQSRNDYGEGSLWWLPHVEARFPDSADDSLLNRAWLDRAATAKHQPQGNARIAVDLGGGNAGDRSVILCRDENGLLALEHSNVWDLGDTAARTATLARKHAVPASRISFDVGGLGFDFANRLASVGLAGATPYLGGASGGDLYGNLRSAAAWLMRQRLDPDHKHNGRVPPAFAIRSEWMALMRRELQGMRYTLGERDKVSLQKKEDFTKMLGHSPDFADCFAMSFAFPNL
jgi:hypothetical protein